MTGRLLFLGCLLFGMSMLCTVATGVHRQSLRKLPPLPLRTHGRWVVDALGHRVKFAGINWYGFDSSDFVIGGLQANSLQSIIDWMVTILGANAVRIPYSLELLHRNPVITNRTLIAANPQFYGRKAIEILDAVIYALNASGVLIMLDNHVSDAIWCCSETDDNGLWFNQRYSAQQWLNDWKSMVKRYAHVPAVVAIDLRNELRANCAQTDRLILGEKLSHINNVQLWNDAEGCLTPTWGGKNKTLDWAAVAEAAGNALLDINPNLLIVVEGLNYANDLTGVRTRPIKLKHPNRVVYEAHNYQWDYTPYLDCDDLQQRGLDPFWGYIAHESIAPVFVGEWGTCYAPDLCVITSYIWMECITWYLWNYDFDWFYWAIDGTQSSGAGRTWGSAETYGLLNVSWSGSSWPWFLENKLRPMIHPRK
jgi:endoglucanase